MSAYQARRTLLLLCGLLLASCPAWGQAPVQNRVRFIVPFPPAGIADVLARLIAAPLGPALGQTIVVENRPGAGGMIGAEIVAKGAPDGNLLVIAGQTIATAQSLFKNLSFSPFKDLAPIAQIGNTPTVLVVGANHRAQSVKELIDMARANPGKLNYATVGNGSVQQLAAEMFKRDTGVAVVPIPYKGGPEIVAVTMAGTVDFMFDNLLSSQGPLRGGKLRALAITTRERDPAFPNVPTMIEAGFPGFLVATWNGVWTTGGTPPERVARLESEIRRILETPETLEAIRKTGVQVTNVGSREFARFVEQEAAHWDRILKAAGIRPE